MADRQHEDDHDQDQDHNDNDEDHDDENGEGEDGEEEKKEEEEGEFSVKALTLELFNESTGHGLPRIVGARGNTTRIFWIILFSGAMAAFVYNTYTIVDQFLQYDVSIGTNVEFK